MKKTIGILTIALFFCVLAQDALCDKPKLGLIIIAHGSPNPQWNAPVLELEKEVLTKLSEKKDHPFSAVCVALMEFNEPSINTVINDMEQSGIDKIYAIPLLIAPSGHSLFDVPTILGIYYEEEIAGEIKEEGTTIVNTKMKITLGPTLNSGGVLKKILLDRVKDLSTSPKSEGAVLLAHGDHYFEPIWSSLCSEIGSYICAQTGIEHFDYAFAEVGQSFIAEAVPVILGMAEKREKTIVVGLYLSMGVERMAGNSAISIGSMKIESKDILKDYNIKFAKRGLLPDPRIPEWIVEKALKWANEL